MRKAGRGPFDVNAAPTVVEDEDEVEKRSGRGEDKSKGRRGHGRVGLVEEGEDADGPGSSLVERP